MELTTSLIMGLTDQECRAALLLLAGGEPEIETATFPAINRVLAETR